MFEPLLEDEDEVMKYTAVAVYKVFRIDTYTCYSKLSIYISLFIIYCERHYSSMVQHIIKINEDIGANRLLE